MDTAPPTTDFRSHLKAEFLRRCRRNPRYSVRAFARTLGLSHATLSHLLRGRRAFTERTIRSMAEPLALGPVELSNFVSALSDGTGSKAPEYDLLTLDRFAAAADWYHDAILELVHLPKFRPDTRWIATRLSMNETEVEAACERLRNLGLLEVTPEGRWIDRSPFSTNLPEDGYTAIAHRQYQRQILEKAAEAVDEIPASERDQTSMTMAASSADLVEARRRIREFRRDLCAYLQRDGVAADTVYQLSVSLFPLDTPEEMKMENEDVA